MTSSTERYTVQVQTEADDVVKRFDNVLGWHIDYNEKIVIELENEVILINPASVRAVTVPKVETPEVEEMTW